MKGRNTLARTRLNHQPHCRCCGKKIKKVTNTIYFKSENSTATNPIDAQPRTKEEAQRFTNEEIVSVRRSHYPVVDGHIFMATTWDQESYEDEFFCTNACAASYGISAARRADLVLKGRQ